MTSHSEEVFYNGVDPQVSAAKALMRIGPPAMPAIPVLIKALKYVRNVRDDDGNGFAWPDFSAAEAAAEVLGSFGPDAKAAVPALIEAAEFREKNEENWRARRAALLALGRIGPDAKTAIPILERIIADDRKASPRAEAITALYQLAPDGKQIAEKWLEQSTGLRGNWHVRPFLQVKAGEVRDRALVIGAMGRASVEGDCLTRQGLERLHWIFDLAGSRRPDSREDFGEWFEDLGLGGRLAVPALTELCKHGDPWVRMWATEASNGSPRQTVRDDCFRRPGTMRRRDLRTNSCPARIHGLAARPGKGPCDHDHTGHRVFAVPIVFSLFTLPARKIRIARAAAAPAIHRSHGNRGSPSSRSPASSFAGPGRANRA